MLLQPVLRSGYISFVPVLRIRFILIRLRIWPKIEKYLLFITFFRIRNTAFCSIGSTFFKIVLISIVVILSSYYAICLLCYVQVEPCCGTHLASAADINNFVVVSCRNRLFNFSFSYIPFYHSSLFFVCISPGKQSEWETYPWYYQTSDWKVFS